VGSAAFFATNNQSRYTANFSTTPNKVQVSLSGSGANLVWKGDGSANLWNVVGAANWLSGGSPAQFYQADSVTFDDSSSNMTVNLSGSLNPLTTTVNSTSNYSIAGTGKLSGPTSLTKSGTGKLTIGTANDFVGATVVNAGTVVIGAENNLGTVPAAATANQLVLNSNVTLQTTATLALSANRGIGLGPTSGTGSATILVATNTTATVNGVIANRGGTGGLVVDGGVT